jgi:hypothetical protein
MATSRRPFNIHQLRARFLSILPRIKTHARIYFRQVKCYHKKADCISETIALAWKWFVRLAERGKDACRFATALASYAAKAVKAGRRVCRQLKAKDALSERAQQKHGFVVGKLPDFSTLSANPLAEALTDNTRSDPAEQAAFRIDFPAWLKLHCKRDRAMIRDASAGERTADLAARYRLSQPRISQLRREWFEEWKAYTADPAEQQ